MRDLLESMNKFAGERVGQKPGDQVRGSEPMPRKGGHKKHPYAGRLVGAAESSESILKELDQVLNENPVRRDLFKEWEEYKALSEGSVRVAADRDPDDPDNYDSIRFRVQRPDGSIHNVEPYSGDHANYYRQVTGKEPGMSPTGREMFDRSVDLFKTQQQGPKKEYPIINEPDQQSPQDRIVPSKQTGPEPDEDDIVAEWGAAGTAVGPGNDDADPVELAAQRAQQVAGKTDQRNQVAGLVAQVNGARSELAGLNKQFPQGANPVEKAMSLQQMQGQRAALSRQIEDLMSQVAALRSQA
jgi:hypothetical protein